jgi:CRP/FNR family cyclic AMP-dependent transcriptional regulator
MNTTHLQESAAVLFEENRLMPVKPAEISVAMALAEHPFIKGMSQHQQRLLTDCAMFTHFKPGEFIIHSGDPANRFYLITKGKVVIEAYVDGRGRVPLETLGAGDVVGWSWLFPPYLWHFDAQAVDSTDAVFVYGTPLREECENDRDFGYEMMKRMTEVVINRLQSARKQLLNIVF